MPPSAHASSYLTNLEKLVKAAAIDDSSVTIDESFPEGIWKDRRTDMLVQEYLKKDAYLAFKRTVSEYEQCMKKIALNLEGIKRPPNVSKDDLHGLLKCNLPEANLSFTFKNRIALAMRNHELEDLVRQLKDSNLTLDCFIGDRLVIESLDRKAAVSHRPREIAATFQEIRQRADRLYAALEQARTSDCEAGHSVLLHLENRAPPKTKKDSIAAGRTTEVSFSISLALRAGTSEDVYWHNGIVLARQNEVPRQDPIGDLCQTVERAHSSRHTFQLHLWDEVLTWGPTTKAPSAQEVVDTVSLAQVLESQRKYRPKQRLDLALKLASSLLQLSYTRWLPNCWSRESIRLFRLANKDIIYFSQPVLAETFHQAAVPQDPPPSNPTDELFELGVLLMEIFLCKQFEAYVAETNQTCIDKTRMARLPLVFRWFERDREEFPKRYRAVVANCIKFNFDEYECHWENAILRQAMCAAIVEPLEKDYSEIW